MTRARPYPLLPIALCLGWLGFWGPWLAHPAAALQLNAYELSEWVTFLPAVQAGQVPLNRLAFLAPSACLAVLCALAVRGAGAAPGAGRTRGWLGALLPDSLLGWLLLGLAALSAMTVFPYYPYLLTAYADPEFQGQLVVAGLTTLAAGVALLLPDDANALAQIAAALVGGVLSVWALVTLWPATLELLGPAWTLGWGWAALLLSFASALIHGWGALFRPRR